MSAKHLIRPLAMRTKAASITTTKRHLKSLGLVLIWRAKEQTCCQYNLAKALLPQLVGPTRNVFSTSWSIQAKLKTCAPTKWSITDPKRWLKAARASMTLAPVYQHFTVHSTLLVLMPTARHAPVTSKPARYAIRDHTWLRPTSAFSARLAANPVMPRNA